MEGEYMIAWILIGLLVAGGLLYGLSCWCRQAREVLDQRRDMVENATAQYYACRQRMEDGEPDAEAVCQRSMRIYQQAVEHYEEALDDPRYRLPAIWMGYRNMR